VLSHSDRKAISEQELISKVINGSWVIFALGVVHYAKVENEA
jgi:hypothetical protein